MAEENTGNTAAIEEGEPLLQVDMDVETAPLGESNAPESSEVHLNGAEKPEENGGSKRGREEEDDGGEGNGASKKPNLERSVEEQRLQKLEGKEVGGDDGVEKEVKEIEEIKDVRKEESVPAAGSIGPKIFCSSVEMFDYFYNLLHFWPPNLDINKYEYMVLLELLNKGHTDAARKIGEGIRAFQVRYHPIFKSKCFFVVRVDGSVDDFSFRKCVDQILPLPDNMKLSSSSNGKKGSGQQRGGSGRNSGGRNGGGGGGDGGGFHGRGRGGRGGGRGHGGRRR